MRELIWNKFHFNIPTDAQMQQESLIKELQISENH